MKAPRFLLAACIALALAFTFSCSSDSSDDPLPVQSSSSDDGGSSSSSSGGNSSSSDGAQVGIGCGIQGYNTVQIGDQLWMAENLNCDVSGSECYDDDPSNCEVYGRLYTWEAAMSVCPSGWYLPSNADWDELMDAVGGISVAGTKLKKTSGWYDESEYYITGTDEYGFSALPGGLGIWDGSFRYVGDSGNWWSSSEYDSLSAYGRGMSYDGSSVGWGDKAKAFLFSVRCLQD